MSKTIHKKKRPQPTAHHSASELMYRMQHKHLDLLQNVEFLLLQGYRQDQSIDDAVVAQALRAILKSEVPEDERAITLVESLLEWEEQRFQQTHVQIADRVWHDVYRVILDSVYRHSTLQPDNRDYLAFIARFFR